MATPDTTHLCVGLRFRGRDYFLLRDLAQQAARRETNLSTGLFDQAAEAVAKGEPLVLFCTSIEEARWYAAEFTRRGINEPTIEQLSGAA